MPGSSFGKGHAHVKPGFSSAYAELSRKSAQAHETNANALDTECESEIIHLASGLESDRRKQACREIRKALAVARRGKVPREDTAVTKCPMCTSKAGRMHIFLCITRLRNPCKLEKGIAEKVWAALDEFAKRNQQQERHSPTTAAPRLACFRAPCTPKPVCRRRLAVWTTPAARAEQALLLLPRCSRQGTRRPLPAAPARARLRSSAPRVPLPPPPRVPLPPPPLGHPVPSSPPRPKVPIPQLAPYFVIHFWRISTLPVAPSPSPPLTPPLTPPLPLPPPPPLRLRCSCVYNARW